MCVFAIRDSNTGLHSACEFKVELIVSLVTVSLFVKEFLNFKSVSLRLESECQ